MYFNVVGSNPTEVKKKLLGKKNLVLACKQFVPGLKIVEKSTSIFTHGFCKYIYIDILYL